MILTCSFSKEFSASAYTNVENSFIREYLPMATGEAVKVYLYGLYMCQNPQRDLSLVELSQTLEMDEKTIVDCFMFWEEFGLVAVLSKEPLTVQFLPIKRTSATKPRKYNAEKYSDFSKSLDLILTSRMISTSEYTEYFNIMETYGIKPDAMLLIVRYCVDRKGEDIGYKYIAKVAKDFGNREITTVDKVEKELSSYILRTGEISKVLKALKLKRQPDIEDQKLFKKWTEELNFETDNIVFAASKMKKSGIDKLDEFIMELYALKSFTKEEIADYITKKELVYQLAIKINRALSIYVDVLDTEVDTYIKKWLSYGFTEDTLSFIAQYCFRKGTNTLEEMDGVIALLRNRGFITLSSVGDYFEEQKQTDLFISKILATAGINRRPTDWDRENLNVWKGWNLSEEMILEASKKSAGRSSPIAYMNAILSNWKNTGVFTIEEAEKSSSIIKPANTQEAYNAEYERRREIALTKAQRNSDIAMAIDGFPTIYARLNSIEKDLAFAEMASDKEALIKLENEKEELTSKASLLLKQKKLTLRDLSPVYKCDKCNDTGYVGTARCDCFDK